MKSDKPLSVQLSEYRPEPGHRMPLTRRELLSVGLLQGLAWVTLPSIVTLLSRHAQGQTLSYPGFLEINAAGGAGFHANVAILDQGRQRLPSYTKSGQGMGADITQTLSDGVTPIFANKVAVFKNSGMFASLDANPALKNILKQTYLFTIPGSTLSDTGENQISAQGLVQRLVGSGLYLPNTQTDTKINQSAFTAPPTPLTVNNFTTLQDAISVRSTDTLGGLPASSRQALFKFVKGLNTSQINQLNSRPGGADLNQALSVASDKAGVLLSGSSLQLDPRQDSALTSLWGLTGAANNDAKVIRAAITSAVARGVASTGGISIGGYDYHGQTRAVTNNLDKALWDVIGNALATFALIQKPAVIFVTTDGTVQGATDPDQGWTGDSNIMASSHVIVYSPNQLNIAQVGSQLETQIGQFTTGQVADQSHPAASARGMAVSAFLNFAQLAGLKSQAVDLLAKNGASFTSTQLDQMLKIRG